MILAAAGQTNWGAWLVVSLLAIWLISNVLLTASVWTQHWKKLALVARLESVAARLVEDANRSAADRAQAEADRKLMQKILNVISGWVFVFEKKEADKQQQLEKVAVTAQQNAFELKRAVEQVPDQVVQKLDEKAADSSILKKPK